MHDFKFNWSPGLGDPTFMGWVTVFLYFVTAVMCLVVARRLVADRPGVASERRVWFALAVMFVLLGINKQLDLQSAFTEIGRFVAFYQGWYEHRRFVQLAFVLLIASFGLVALLGVGFWAWRTRTGAWLALIGSGLLLIFIVLRAASFHHLDHFIGSGISGIRWNWILEIGGILIVLEAGRRRRAALAPSPEPGGNAAAASTQ